MNVGSVSISERFVQTTKCCPECGAAMLEVDRCNENGNLFVWYRCSKNNCDGQWLQKSPSNNLT